MDVLTLLVGLVVGPVALDLAVPADTAAVMLELDGRSVARLEAPPWRAELDLGPGLRSHRLTAVALDAAGRELRRAQRFLNLYRPPAGVGYVLHRNSQGWLTLLELDWAPRAGSEMVHFAVSVDGRGVEVDDPARVWVPPLDPSTFHLIEAVAAYEDGTVTRDWLGFGGTVLGEGSALLTPVQTTAAGERLGARDAAGHELRVAAVTRGESEIVVVRDDRVAAAADRFVPGRSVSGTLTGARDAQAARRIHSVPIERDEWVRIVDASAPRVPGSELDPHALEPRLTSDVPGDFGLLWHLRTLDSEVETDAPWPADAVALAAARLATGQRRAAVVVALAGDSSADGGRFDSAGVSDYLEGLGVPLEVWYFGKIAKAPRTWGEPREVRNVGDLERALEGLRTELDGRAVAWVEGLHAPDRVTIEPAAD